MRHSFDTRGARSLLPLVALLALPALPAPQAPQTPQPSPPEAGLITQANLLESERFWPYRVALTEPWQPQGREKPLPAGSTGVLIRVESSGTARIDFSSDGKYEVPIARTDLVQNANRIRRGELAKAGPNFTWTIQARMIDSASEQPQSLSPRVVVGYTGFLCVFVDPQDEAFEQIAAGLAPLRESPGVLTILFPQGHVDGPRLRERLRALGWTVPFLFDFLSEPYTRTLLPEDTPLPALLLQTNEGRRVFQSGWRKDVVPELTEALDAAFGPTQATTADTSQQPGN